MTKQEICIICPKGCRLQAEVADKEVTVDGSAGCARGREYLLQELKAPQRSVTSSMLVQGGALPIVSVRSSAPIPKERIWDVMACIKRARVNAPIRIEQTLIRNVCGLDCDIISTKNVLVDEQSR